MDKDELAQQSSARERHTDRAYKDADNETNLSVSNDRIEELDESLQLDVDSATGLAETGALQNIHSGNRSPFDIDWAANRGAPQDQTEAYHSEDLPPPFSGTEDTGSPEPNLANTELGTTTSTSAIQSRTASRQAAPVNNIEAARLTPEPPASMPDSAARASAASSQTSSLAQVAPAFDQTAVETEVFLPAGETAPEDFTTVTNSILAELESESKTPSTTGSDIAGDDKKIGHTGQDGSEPEATRREPETPDNQDTAPGLAEISAQSGPEDAAFTYDASAHFPDVDTGDSLVYFLDGPDWLSIDSHTGQLSGTPQNEDVGTTSFAVRVMSPTGTSINTSFFLTVENAVDGPMVSSISEQAGNEDCSFYYDASAHFADMDDGDTLIYSMDGPSWLSIDASTGKLFGTPNNYDMETSSITITATDGSGEATATTFNLTVSITNDGPAAILVADQSASESALFTHRAADHFAEVDAGDTLIYSLTGPDWLTIDANTGILSGTPTNDDIGIVSVTVIATGRSGRSASISFELSVDNVNDTPSVTDIFDHTPPEDTGFSYDAASHFSDAGGGALSFGVSGPNWLFIDPATGTLTGSPTNDDIGPTLVTVTVTDQSGARASTDFHLAVTNVNDAPAVTAIEDLGAMEDTAFAYDTSKHFSDVDSGDVLTYSINGPDWLSIDDASGELSGTPTNANVGPTLVTVTTTDLFGDSATVDFHVVVDNVNDAPTVTTIEDLTTFENAKFSFDASTQFSDSDASDTLACSISDPERLSINSNSGELTGTPATRELGQAPDTVTDPEGASVSGTFDLIVDKINVIKVSGYGGTGNETNEGQSNEDTIIGAGGDDSLSEASESDLKLGGDGADSISGGTIGGATLDDYMFGDVGDDSISGEEGDDNISGDAGADTLAEGQGNDTFVVFESKGNDTISGGSSSTNVIQVSDSSRSGAPTEAWTVSVDDGDAQTITSDHGFLNLGADRSGTITFNDGTEVTFDGIERIEW